MTADFSTPSRPDATAGTSRTGAPFGSRPLAAGAETQAADSADCPNVLGKGTEFTGTIEVSDSIRLEGRFKGEVWTQGTLHVVPEANVEAQVQAAFVVIGGRFKGSVECDQRVDLLTDCRATGSLRTAALTVEEGALFDGNISMTKSPRKPPREDTRPDA